MAVNHQIIPTNYWEQIKINDQDLEYLYNYLLDVETPLTSVELSRELINFRIQEEIRVFESKTQANTEIYAPKGRYVTGQALKFPALNWAEGTVSSVHPGQNPQLPPFEVIEVQLNSGETKLFAAGVEDHILNQPPEVNSADPLLNVDMVTKHHGKQITQRLTNILESNPDLVEIAGRWFPKALLVDVNQGYLNLAEALLEMENGGPLPASAILNGIELPTDVNSKLTEFSLNYFLQEDERFDEVGPAGETLWFLNRMEPAEVQHTPIWLREATGIKVEPTDVTSLLSQMNPETFDELETTFPNATPEDLDQITIRLIYPHWRSGTLPLTKSIARLFPTAYESPRVQFTFVDGETGQRFNGWVVRVNHYVYGLRDWFLSLGILPGSLITIQRSSKPGEVILNTGKRKAVKDWVRTALIGADGGIVFATLKQQIATTLDEHMGIVLSNPQLLDPIWEQPKSKTSFEQIVINMMREISKLTPQGHVHAAELYAAVNLIRRCPPTPILQLLKSQPWSLHLGDLYFRLTDEDGLRDTHE